MRHAQRAGGVTGPAQLCLRRIRRHDKLPGQRGLRIVAITVRRQPGGEGVALCGQRGDAENELAGAASQHNTRQRHAVKSGKLRTQIGVIGVRVLTGIGLLHRRPCGGARPAGIAVA